MGLGGGFFRFGDGCFCMSGMSGMSGVCGVCEMSGVCEMRWWDDGISYLCHIYLYHITISTKPNIKFLPAASAQVGGIRQDLSHSLLRYGR